MSPTSAPTSTAAHLMFGRWHVGRTKRTPLAPLLFSRDTRKSLAGAEACACARDGRHGLLPKRTFMRNGPCLQLQTKFLWKKGDGQTIDGFINNFSMVFIPLLTKLAGRAQSGYIFTYAFAMVLGIVVLITWMTLGAGG